MKSLFVIIGFIDHIVLSFIAIDLIGSFMIDSISVLKTILYGLLMFLIIISIIFHISIIIYKNKS